MQILFIIMSLVFWGYVAYIVVKFGFLPSLSDSYYHLSVKTRDVIFTLVLWCTGIMAMILGQSGLMFFAGAGICFVGAAPQFLEKFVKPIHIAGAFCSGLFSQLYILINTSFWWISIIFIFIGLIFLLMRIKNLVWWIEMLCFASTFLTLGLITFN